uniref:PDZ and pleckstrin homology domains 1 n=1 Tax=Denticeps clupeoides TaxID=299321 RepID=A0AAY4B5Z5_9TELE
MEETCPEKAFRRDLLIQITPPSPGASQEQITEDNYNAKPDSQRRKIRSSVVTTIIGGCEQKFVKSDTQSDEETYEENLLDTNSMVLDCQAIDMAEDIETVVEDPLSHQCPPIGGLRNTSQPDPPIATEATAFQGDSNSFELGDISPQGCKGVLESGGESMDLRPTCSNTDSEDKGCTTTPQKTNLYHTDCAEKHSSSKSKATLVKEHLKPPADPVFKDPEDSSDHWAKRRKQFKDTKQWSSAGGSSITSNITDESETRSVDISVRDIEDRGFYTETFHAASWIFCGDGSNSSQTPRGLSKRPRPVTIRDRTVKICKGMGDYPWGFRIQFSKPIVVTEVDTNGAAEEAGLLVGDYVQAVNGTDVTSVPHSEAADLARQGPDLLTLTIGSDISRCPNTPRPACRGYLHKRTQYSLIKGWRKRWFVLKHDCCLHYYRHKRDEGKSRSLSIVKLEGAEVGPDTSLGKPFVFKCAPVSGGRVFYFCATSNQEMKRWLEALNCAVHPITQNHVWVDVTRHNASLPPLAIKTPDCLGLLHQLDRNKDTWVQHYCILKDGCLYFYPSIRSTHALGGIYLHGYMVREQPQGSKRSTIELRPPSEEFKTFYLCAENATENKRWILAMKASLSKWVPLHQAIQDFIRRPAEETKM